MKQCKLCNRQIETKNRCNSCSTRIRRYRCKRAAIKYLGGKCNRCNWAGDIAGFDFHHKDSSQKEFQIGSAVNKKWEVVKLELNKCELLCANCHRIHHTANRDENFLKEVDNYKGRLLN